MRTCTTDGCDNAHRARGLCSTHYNEAHQLDRHPKFTITCETCGVEHVTLRKDGRFCSLKCRDMARASVPHAVYFPTCLACGEVFCSRKADKAHCSATCWRALDQATRPTPIKVEWRTERECRGCAATFCPLFTPTQLDCSRRCARRMSRLARRAAEAGAHGTYRWSDFMRIAQRFGYRCAYCGIKPDALDPDHVVPLSKGGPNTPSNLLPSCRACNCDKRDVLLHEWNADRVRRGLETRVTSWPAGDRRYLHLTSVLCHAA